MVATWVVVLLILALIVAITALVLAIIWRKKSTPVNPSIPSNMGIVITNMTPEFPSDVTFLPDTAIQYTIVSKRLDSTTIENSMLLHSSSVTAIRPTADITTLQFSFLLPNSLCGTIIDAFQVSVLGNGAPVTQQALAPVAVLQPITIVDLPDTSQKKFVLFYNLSGATIPAGQQLPLSFQISYLFQTSG